MVRLESVDRVLEAMAAVVAEAGEEYVCPTVDDSCVYVWGYKCCCLVARVLHRLGWTVTELARMDAYSQPDSGFAGSTIALLGGEEPYVRYLTPPIVNLLSLVQVMQDDGATWGRCLMAARVVSGRSAA